MKFNDGSADSGLKSRIQGFRGAGFFCVIALLSSYSPLFAQSPNPAANGPTKDNPGGFTPGMTLGAKFEGSSSGDGAVYDLGSALGYNFSRHFGVDVGLPFYFVSTPSSIKKNDPGAVSGIGVGTLFTDLRLNYPNPSLNFSSTLHLTAPTGDTKKGLSTGHATWNLANHFDHAFGDLSPFLDAGVGNSVMDTRFFHRPFVTFGYNAQFNGGVEYDPGKFSFSASAYDVCTLGESNSDQPGLPLQFPRQMQPRGTDQKPQEFHHRQRLHGRRGSRARQRLQCGNRLQAGWLLGSRVRL